MLVDRILPACRPPPPRCRPQSPWIQTPATLTQTPQIQTPPPGSRHSPLVMWPVMHAGKPPLVARTSFAVGDEARAVNKHLSFTYTILILIIHFNNYFEDHNNLSQLTIFQLHSAVNSLTTINNIITSLLYCVHCVSSLKFQISKYLW